MADEKSLVKMNKMIHKKTRASFLVVYIIYVNLVYTDSKKTVSCLLRRHIIFATFGRQIKIDRQRVKAKWNSDFRFGGKSAAASNKASHAASKSLLFSFVLDTFQAISVIFFNSTGTRRRISDLWICW